MEGSDVTYSMPIRADLVADVTPRKEPFRAVYGYSRYGTQSGYEVWPSDEEAEANSMHCNNSYSHDRIALKRQDVQALLDGMVAIVIINGGEYDLHLSVEPKEGA